MLIGRPVKGLIGSEYPKYERIGIDSKKRTKDARPVDTKTARFVTDAAFIFVDGQTALWKI